MVNVGIFKLEELYIIDLHIKMIDIRGITYIS